MVRTSLALLIVAALSGSPALAATSTSGTAGGASAHASGGSSGGGHGGSAGVAHGGFSAHGSAVHTVSATGASHGHHGHHMGGTGHHHHHLGATTVASRNLTPLRDCQPGAVQYLESHGFCSAPAKVRADGKLG